MITKENNTRNKNKCNNNYDYIDFEKDPALQTLINIKPFGVSNSDIIYSYNPKELYRLCRNPNEKLIASIDGIMSIFNSNLISINDVVDKIKEMIYKYQPNNYIAINHNIYKKIGQKQQDSSCWFEHGCLDWNYIN